MTDKEHDEYVGSMNTKHRVTILKLQHFWQETLFA